MGCSNASRTGRYEPLRKEVVALMLAALFLGFAGLPTVLRGETEMSSVSGKVYGFTCHDNVVPLAGATVSARLTETGFIPLTVTASPDGSYNLTLPSGEYMLYIAAPFFRTEASYSFAVASGIVISGLNFYLYPVTPPYCSAVMFRENLYTLAIYSNASATKLIFDSDRSLVNFTVSSKNETNGRLLIVIPRVLLDGTPVVLVDNVEVNSTFVEGATNYFVEFDYSLGSHAVTIGGYKTIPEFPLGYEPIEMALFLILTVFLSTKKYKFNCRRSRHVTHARKPSV